MGQVLDHKTVPTTIQTDQGEQTVEQLRSVTFQDANGAVHTLTFYNPGDNVAGADEGNPRIVGEDVPHFAFTDPHEAVAAFERGELA